MRAAPWAWLSCRLRCRWRARARSRLSRLDPADCLQFSGGESPPPNPPPASGRGNRLPAGARLRINLDSRRIGLRGRSYFLLPLPLAGEGVGGLWPPFLIEERRCESIGYGGGASAHSDSRRGPRAKQLTIQPSGLRRKPDDMTRAAAFGRRAHRNLVDRETGITQPFCKFRVRPRRPDREHTGRPQRPVDRLQPLRIVERVIGLANETFGTVVDIEQDGIERFRLRSYHLDDVGLPNVRAGILQALAKNVLHRAARPDDHGGP